MGLVGDMQGEFYLMVWPVFLYLLQFLAGSVLFPTALGWFCIFYIL